MHMDLPDIWAMTFHGRQHPVTKPWTILACVTSSNVHHAKILDDVHFITE